MPNRRVRETASGGEIERSAKKASELCRQMLTYSGKGRFLGKGVPGFIEKPYEPHKLLAELRGIFDPS